MAPAPDAGLRGWLRIIILSISFYSTIDLCWLRFVNLK